MKPHLSERAVSGCPCGRSHPTAGPRRRRQPRRSEDGLPTAAYEALCAGKAVQDGQSFWWIHHAGTCTQPITMSAHNHPTRILAKRLVRCRKCVECLHARRYYWAKAAIEQTRVAHEQGRRTWFGTLTLSPESQREMLARARLASEESNAEYWDDPLCDARFAAVRRELVLECRRYWARLRKAGHTFKYFLVFERHKSGLPHMHWLLHEVSGPILKRELQAQWPWGFSNCHVVGGAAKQAVAPEQAAWYVAKYLAKAEQARQIASKGYRPTMRARRHSEVKRNVKQSRDDPKETERDDHAQRREAKPHSHKTVVSGVEQC